MYFSFLLLPFSFSSSFPFTFLLLLSSSSFFLFLFHDLPSLPIILLEEIRNSGMTHIMHNWQYAIPTGVLYCETSTKFKSSRKFVCGWLNVFLGFIYLFCCVSPSVDTVNEVLEGFTFFFFTIRKG